MKQFLLIVLITATGILPMKAQSHFATWVKHIQGHETSAFNNIVADGSDIVASGYWFLDATFEGIELPYFTSSNNLLVKMDSAGALKWSATMTGDGYETFYDMALDGEKNIVLTGWSSSNDPITINGDTVFIPEMEWISRGVVAKFSGADGHLIWYKTFFSEMEYSTVNATRLSVDGNNNVYVMGYHDATFKIDTFSVIFNQPNYGNSPFVAKFDTDGQAQWVKTFDFVTEGYGGFITPRAMKTSETDLFVGFEYSKPLIVNEEPLPYTGEYYWNAVFKMSFTDGTVSKTAAFGSDLGQGLKSLDIDLQGNVVVGGFFSANSGFKIESQTLTGYGETDGFVAKFDDQLNLVWLKQMGGDYSDQLFNITIGSNNKIYLGGGFDCYTAFKYEETEVIASKMPNSLSMFQLIIDTHGNFTQAYPLYAENIFGRMDYRDAALMNDELMFIAGASADSVAFVEDDMFFSEHDAAFLLRWDFSSFTNIKNQRPEGFVTLFPNPANDKFIVSGVQHLKGVELFDLQGKMVLQENTSKANNIISIANLTEGVYLVRIITELGLQTFKIQISK